MGRRELVASRGLASTVRGGEEKGGLLANCEKGWCSPAAGHYIARVRAQGTVPLVLDSPVTNFYTP